MKRNGEFVNAGLQEGEVINRWFENRFKANKNILAATVGETGSGKSYANLRCAELWYRYYFNRDFPLENICFSIKQAMQLINTNKLPRGSIIIVEEAGVIMNSLDFQNKLVKFFGFVLQSFRSKNIGIIFNLPNIAFLSKTGRVLLHGTFITTSIDKSTSTVKLKVFRTQVNPMTGKIYNKFIKIKINNHSVPIKRVNYGLPSKHILEYYEKAKDEFVNKVNKQLLDEIEEQEDNSFNKEKLKELVRPLYFKGIKTAKDISEMIGISAQQLGKYGLTSIMVELALEMRESNESKNINTIKT